MKITKTDGLRPESAALLEAIKTQFGVADPAGLAVLQTAVAAHSRMLEAEAELTRDGLTIADRWGQLKPHPASTILRESRAGFYAGIKALQLDVAALPDTRRPDAS